MSIPDSQRRLRAWAETHASQGNLIRDEFARSALSAVLRRLALFGVEDALNRYSARELLVFQTMCSGDFALILARITCTRAMVEDDREVLNAMSEAGLAIEQLAWHAEFVSVEASKANDLLDAITDRDEELHVARLLVARRHPACIQSAWLEAVPARLPLIAAHLCRTTLLSRPDLAGSVAHILVQQPATLMAVEPDTLLAPLVAVGSFAPQHVLAPFEGIYGERTVVAAAEWHLEHGQPQQALELCQRVRPLSNMADRARQAAVIAHLELNQIDFARSAAASILDQDLADAATLALAAHDAQLIPTAAVIAIAHRCPMHRPESFFNAIRVLLGRRELPQVRTICRQRQPDFATHPTLREVFVTVLGVAHG